MIASIFPPGGHIRELEDIDMIGAQPSKTFIQIVKKRLPVSRRRLRRDDDAVARDRPYRLAELSFFRQPFE
jgi:hypothetical protein